MRAFVANGVYRVRWTGGEPTSLKKFPEIVRQVRQIGMEDQMLSTNGSLLAPMASELREAGVSRVNISLDTLDRERFRLVTGRDALQKVLASIKTSIGVFDFTKINCVLLKENLGDVVELLRFVSNFKEGRAKVAVRFIELVKGCFEGDNTIFDEHSYPMGEALQAIQNNFGAYEQIVVAGDNPQASYFRLKDSGTQFGFVQHFSINYACGGKRCKKFRVNYRGLKPAASGC
jgi:cyclic pyranopterin phosphate synthase